MIKLSKMTDYAVVILGRMAQGGDGLQTASGLSEKTGLPEPTVAKVLKLLARGGLIESTRGVNGGYALSRMPAEINMASVIFALEGPVQLTSCVGAADDCCSHSVNCSMKGKWDPVNEAMKKALEDVSLAQMISSHEVTA
ncbi:MAG TPA: SUF system Fe-S cluster assembly regulator [Micavibrio sp.]|nr:SUF system Fe-S cluster assembly regulator [Micavibrio sp.]